MTEEPGEGGGIEHHFSRSNRRLGRLPALVAEAVAIVWRSAPRELIVTSLIQLVSGAALGAQVLVIRNLLADLLGPDGADFGRVVPELAVLAVVGTLVPVLGVLQNVQQRVLGQLVAMHTAEQVIATATTVDLVTYEEPGFHDRLQRARMSAAARPAQLTAGILGLASSLFAIGGISVALVLIEPVFLALVLVAFVPAWLATNYASRFVYEFSVGQTERERRRQYLYNLLTSRQGAQEVRAFDLGRFLGDRHRKLFDLHLSDLRQILRRRLRVGLAGQMATALLTAGAVAVLVWFLTSGRMSVSEAGSAAGALVLMSGRLGSLSASAGGLYDGSLYLEDYTSFVAAARRIDDRRPTDAAPDDVATLEARDVSFTYPSRSRPSLVDASIVVRRGEVVALVGENGSGKTTFAKLLAGLYTPSSGSVAADGVDLAGVDPTSARRLIAVIFQDYGRYQLTVRENIALGDHARFDDDEAVERAARAAGAHEWVQGLEHGFDTLLGAEFYGGSDVSIGQWQRTALARAFFRDAPVVILDEPTAALDPRAEAALYTGMRELFSGRGVLLISHRFGSVRGADRIYVMRDGHVVEQGDHETLIGLDGHYAELFGLQAQWYVD